MVRKYHLTAFLIKLEIVSFTGSLGKVVKKKKESSRNWPVVRISQLMQESIPGTRR